VSAINQSYTLALLFLSGQVAPLPLLPVPLALAATVLPFRRMVAFPVELLLGRMSPIDTLWGFAAQLTWLGIAWGMLGPVWRAGLRRYAAVGA
jgi:ABC-2 type transport system permease protein